jgi:hypothetical protein
MKGKFRAKAKEWGLGESSTGKEQIAVSFDILTEGAEFSTITWYGYFTEDTWQRTLESLRIMGWTGTDFEQDLVGLDTNEVELVVAEEEFDGKVRTKVQWVNRVGGLNIKAPLTLERTKAFAATMRDRIKAFDATKGSRPAPKPAGRPPEPPPHNDADIPF